MEISLKNKFLAAAAIIAVLMLGLVFAFSIKDKPASGSVMIGGEYQGTTTTSMLTASTTVVYIGSGVLGSVVVTVPQLGTGSFFLYDGTTTTSHPDWSTTTLASFTSGSTAGTYTFDMSVRKGLIFEYKGSASQMSSSTVTFKQYSGF